MSEMKVHVLTYVQSGTWESPATIDKDGNVKVEWDTVEILDVDETSVWCSECGRVSGDEEEHKMSDEWQAV